jgi:parallel beta-helix repeat protein
VTANNRYGICIEDQSNGNIVSSNYVAGNSVGIVLKLDSEYCTISQNTICQNYRGIYIEDSTHSTIYGNDFTDNYQQVYMSSAGLMNYWHNGYPSGGNCWSDYSGADLFSGTYQNESGSDGIGDTPYVIDTSNIDSYPLMPTTPGDINHDSIVDIFDAILLANAFNSISGDPNWNPTADINNDNTVDIFDAIILSNNFGKTT